MNMITVSKRRALLEAAVIALKKGGLIGLFHYKSEYSVLQYNLVNVFLFRLTATSFGLNSTSSGMDESGSISCFKKKKKCNLTRCSVQKRRQKALVAFIITKPSFF